MGFRPLISLLATVMMLGSAEAASTSWRNVEGGAWRVLIQGVDDTTLRGAIELHLNEGWHTYWRNPGEFGLAPSLNIAEAASSTLFFPIPHQIHMDGLSAIGYSGRLLLPFVVKLRREHHTQIAGTAVVGLCERLCLPATLDFNLNSSEENFQDDAVIEVAFDQLPPTRSDELFLTEASIKKNQLFLTLKHPKASTVPELFVDSKTVTLGLARVVERSPTATKFVVPIAENPDSAVQLIYEASVDGRSVSSTFVLQPKR